MEMGAIYYHSDSKNVGEREKDSQCSLLTTETKTITGLAWSACNEVKIKH